MTSCGADAWSSNLAQESASRPRVSVVVPVYNAAKTLDRAITSVLTQTMPADDLELICVDDGSTDDSLARLRSYETDHPNMTVMTIPASGWPGKPRNVGTDAASGTYVMYLDADDQLTPDAMQRMYDLGAANEADIVLGKVTSDFRGVHQYLYRITLPRCGLDDSRIIHSLTPHKMFRRAFLIEHGLRFPEGYRRLEDQLFVVRAYLSARTCSVVADHVCYRYLRQPDRGNIATRIVLPAQYYESVREILDEVDRLTDPGPRRDLVYRRALRVEALAKVTGRRILEREPESLERWLAAIQDLLDERIPERLEADLPTTMRVRAHLVRTATSRELFEFSARTKNLKPEVAVELSAAPDGGLLLDVRGHLRIGDDPFLLERDGDDWLVPGSLIGTEVPAVLRRVEPAEQMMADVILRERSTGDEWFVTPALTMAIEPTDGDRARIVISGAARLDPSTAAAGQPLPSGEYKLAVRVDCLGINKQSPLTTDASESRAVLSRRSTLAVGDAGRLRLIVGCKPGRLRSQLEPRARLTPDGVEVDLTSGWAVRSLTGELITADQRQIKLRLRRVDPDGRRWQTSRSPAWPPGPATLRLKLGSLGQLEASGLLDIPLTVRSLPGVVRRWMAGHGRRPRSAGQRP